MVAEVSLLSLFPASFSLPFPRHCGQQREQAVPGPVLPQTTPCPHPLLACSTKQPSHPPTCVRSPIEK